MTFNLGPTNRTFTEKQNPSATTSTQSFSKPTTNSEQSTDSLSMELTSKLNDLESTTLNLETSTSLLTIQNQPSSTPHASSKRHDTNKGNMSFSTFTTFILIVSSRFLLVWKVLTIVHPFDLEVLFIGTCMQLFLGQKPSRFWFGFQIIVFFFKYVNVHVVRWLDILVDFLYNID